MGDNSDGTNREVTGASYPYLPAPDSTSVRTVLPYFPAHAFEIEVIHPVQGHTRSHSQQQRRLQLITKPRLFRLHLSSFA